METTHIDYKKLLNNSEYDFLRTDKHLGNNICMLVLSGSIACGVNTPESDIDLRGVAMSSLSELTGIVPDFDHVQSNDNDSFIMSTKKAIGLFLECNPNTLELLGCKPEHYLYLNDYGKLILAHKNDFISKRVITKFGGYADDQFNRMEHGLLGNGSNPDKKLLMLRESLQRSIVAFNKMHSDEHINIDLKIVTPEMFNEIYPNKELKNVYDNKLILVDGTFKDVPVTDFKDIISSLHKVQSEYGNINHRNTKKDEYKLAKHQYTLVRLFKEGIELNQGKGIITYREADHDLLVDIRNMKYMTEDKKQVLPEFYDIVHGLQKEWEYSIKHSVLPDEPNYDGIKELVIGLYKDQFTK